MRPSILSIFGHFCKNCLRKDSHDFEAFCREYKMDSCPVPLWTKSCVCILNTILSLFLGHVGLHQEGLQVPEIYDQYLKVQSWRGGCLVWKPQGLVISFRGFSGCLGFLRPGPTFSRYYYSSLQSGLNWPMFRIGSFKSEAMVLNCQNMNFSLWVCLSDCLKWRACWCLVSEWWWKQGKIDGLELHLL